MNPTLSGYPESPPDSGKSGQRLIRGLGRVVLLLIVAVAAYSIYVAVHEPDRQETVLLGQVKLASDSPAGLRILVRNRTSQRPIRRATVELSLLSPSDEKVKLGVFKTDSNGSIADSITIPAILSGEYQLVVDVVSPLGRDQIVKKVEIRSAAQILLTSDKPIYQPGQTIHLRSLVRNGRTDRPISNENVIFEVSDPKGNKVFKETRQSSTFGIASADFVLASELNLGRYHIQARAGAASTERTVETKRYVLPRFKIEITTDRSFYLPGQTVGGVLTAGYFFGKPVNNAVVKVAAKTHQEQPVTVAEITGHTDALGQYHFKFDLPQPLVGLPMLGGQAFVELTAEVRDTAGHAENKVASLTVASHELEVTAIPEAGTLVPSIENILYVMTAYPDGTPAPCKIFVDGKAYQGDTLGMCEAKVVPKDIHQPLTIQAIDSEGRTRDLTYTTESNLASSSLLLRLDKAIYQAGQAARLRVLSSEKNSTIFIDVIKNGQTVLTHSIPLADHQAEYALAFPPSLLGVLKINAYVITASGESRGCARLICIHPASGLRIAAKASQNLYRPGEMAKLDLSVTDAEGKPAPSALGIAAVDESVFALHEARPGLLRQFLEVENDLLKSRHQIKFFDSGRRLFETGNQSLAAAYFASLERSATGPNVDDLVRNGYLSPRVIEHARRLRGSPEFEDVIRANPDYAGVMRLLEGGQGGYSLTEITGPRKAQRVENHRRIYFKNLRHYLGVGFVGLLFFSPILLLLYYSRPGAGLNPQAFSESRGDRYVALAGSLHNQLAVLILLPLVCYPIGFLAFARDGFAEPGWILLGFECVAVFATLFVQYNRLTRAALENLNAEMIPLQICIGVFLVQFVISRAGFVWAYVHPRNADHFAAFLWFIASVIAPLFILAALHSHVRHQLTAKGIASSMIQVTAVEILIVVMILGILSGLMLPALAKAKGKASRVSLVSDLKQIDLASQIAEAERTKPEPGVSAPSRIRRDFPETLLWQPEIITDDRGQATVQFPLADSITTWRTSIEAVNRSGRMGSLEMPIPVFQDFFVDLDLPVSMSLGDQVSVPVTCYNYLKEPQQVRLELTPGNWFESSLDTISLNLGPNEVKSVSFPIQVLRVGSRVLRVTAHGSKMADAIEREIRVVPTGERIDFTRNTILKNTVTETFAIASGAVTESENLWVRFYPSRFSEVVEGLDSVFRAPCGCFEQTSSTTYPNVLVLDYMKRVGRMTPELEVRARQFINAGYQRLLTFESAGGGFEWFGRHPANICLTAYGVLEFTDMARVHPVDESVIARARQWLFGHQNTDGSWEEIQRGWTWSGRGSMTAFVAWALAESGDQSVHLDKALNYLRAHSGELSSMYCKALAANAFLARDRNDAFGRRLAAEIAEAAIVDRQDSVHWTSTGYSVTFSHDSGMDTECTALCVMALMKAGTWPQSVKRAMTWISGRKLEGGIYGSTQATILAMRALLEVSTASLGQEYESTITVLLNDMLVEKFCVNKENSDVMKQIELTPFLCAGQNHIELRQSPVGELPVQLTGAYWLPVTSRDAPDVRRVEELQIEVRYDRTTLAINEQLTCTVTVENKAAQPVNMAMVDLGIPPGFAVDPAPFEGMRQSGRLEKFELTGNHVILYLRQLSNAAPFQFRYSLRANYPLRVQTPASSVYEYYQPQNRAEAKPVILQARGTD